MRRPFLPSAIAASIKTWAFFVSEEDSEDYEEEETQEDYPDEGDAADEEDTKKESDSGIMTLNK